MRITFEIPVQQLTVRSFTRACRLLGWSHMDVLAGRPLETTPLTDDARRSFRKLVIDSDKSTVEIQQDLAAQGFDLATYDQLLALAFATQIQEAWAETEALVEAELSASDHAREAAWQTPEPEGLLRSAAYAMGPADFEAYLSMDLTTAFVYAHAGGIQARQEKLKRAAQEANRKALSDSQA